MAEILKNDWALYLNEEFYIHSDTVNHLLPIKVCLDDHLYIESLLPCHL